MKRHEMGLKTLYSNCAFNLSAWYVIEGPLSRE